MGHGDETNYIYLLKASEVPSVLAHLASSLDPSEYTIDDADVDRIATIEFEGQEYQLPIYAISNNHFSDGEGDGFRPESDFHVTLEPEGDSIAFDSGVWCKPDNILDEDQAERTAKKGKKPVRLTHIGVELSLGNEYMRVKLSVWGGAYWGGTESDPSFVKLVKPLKSMGDIWIVEDETGAYCYKPKMSDDAQEQFGEFYQENDYFEDEGPDTVAAAILGFEPDE